MPEDEALAYDFTVARAVLEYRNHRITEAIRQADRGSMGIDVLINLLAGLREGL